MYVVLRYVMDWDSVYLHNNGVSVDQEPMSGIDCTF